MAMKIYIAGKITGLPIEEVCSKFNAAKEHLSKLGYTPISPLDNGCDSTCWATQMMACLPMLLDCKAIYMLTDWEDSAGAIIERTFALKNSMQIIEQQK